MLLILIAFLTILAYFLLNLSYNYWPKRGVKQGNPLPIFGDNLKTFFSQESFSDMVLNAYKRHPDSRYTGIYQFMVPTLILRDPELIKDIAVKDFDHFLDHRSFISEESDPLWGKNLFALRGKKWRDMRVTLSPAFTGSKMKFMFPLMEKNAQKFVQHFLKRNQDIVTVEMKDASTRFANDVIANTAFGVEIDSLEDSNNQFYKFGKEELNFSGFKKNAKFFGYLLIPSLYKFFNVRLFSEGVTQFFVDLIKGNIESREKHGITRPDMIYLLMEAKKNRLRYEENEEDTEYASAKESEYTKSGGTKIIIDDEDIAAQAFVFFFAGFDTISGQISFMAHELALNREVQKRLQQEVDETLRKCGSNFTYEAMLKMKYMDMVVSESLRKWPNNVIVDRVCTEPYIIQPKLPNEKPINLVIGDIVWLPVLGLHRDPEYYPDPEKFDPERFSEENRDKIVPYTYLPFGAGPRNCIGSRFALMETKILFFHILTHFEIVPVNKTQIPLKLGKQFTMNAERGFWLGLKKRE